MYSSRQEAEGKVVLLGVPSSPINQDDKRSKDYYRSKCGGTPAWMSSSSNRQVKIESLVCPCCHRQLSFVLQIYAPAEQDRCLLIFGCDSSLCASVKGSWRVLRQQQEHRSTETSTNSAYGSNDGFSTSPAEPHSSIGSIQNPAQQSHNEHVAQRSPAAPQSQGQSMWDDVFSAWSDEEKDGAIVADTQETVENNTVRERKTQSETEGGVETHGHGLCDSVKDRQTEKMEQGNGGGGGGRGGQAQALEYGKEREQEGRMDEEGNWDAFEALLAQREKAVGPQRRQEPQKQRKKSNKKHNIGNDGNEHDLKDTSNKHAHDKNQNSLNNTTLVAGRQENESALQAQQQHNTAEKAYTTTQNKINAGQEAQLGSEHSIDPPFYRFPCCLLDVIDEPWAPDTKNRSKTFAHEDELYKKYLAAEASERQAENKDEGVYTSVEHQPIQQQQQRKEEGAEEDWEIPYTGNEGSTSRHTTSRGGVRTGYSRKKEEKQALQRAGQSQSKSQSTVAGGGEKYERTPVREKMMLQFLAKIQLQPEQCLRYAYEGTPLWSSPPRSTPRPRKCVCGRERVFEMQTREFTTLVQTLRQLMPTLIYQLGIDRGNSASGNLSSTIPDICIEKSSESVSSIPWSTEQRLQDGAGGSRDAYMSGRATVENKDMDWESILIYSCPESCELSGEEEILVIPADNSKEGASGK